MNILYLVRVCLLLWLIAFTGCSQKTENQTEPPVQPVQASEQTLINKKLFPENQTKIASDSQRMEKERPEPVEEIKSGKDIDRNGRVSFIWPATGVITSGFGMRNGRMHNGIDIADRKNKDIRAAADGVVVFADRNGRLGKTIVIKHDNGFRTVYSHNARHYVSKGMRVKRGRKIAMMGSSGKSTGVHLHFEIRVNGTPKNPLFFLPAR